jgi:hypothetical protein
MNPLDPQSQLSSIYYLLVEERLINIGLIKLLVMVVCRLVVLSEKEAGMAGSKTPKVSP